MRERVQKYFKEKGFEIENLGTKSEMSSYSCTATTRSASWVVMSKDIIANENGEIVYLYKDSVCGFPPIYLLFNADGKLLINQKTQKRFFKAFEHLALEV